MAGGEEPHVHHNANEKSIEIQDLWMVVHDKVYDVSSFVDEHPYVHPCLPVTGPRSRDSLGRSIALGG